MAELGIYFEVSTNTIRFFGVRRRPDPAGLAWARVTDRTARTLLEDASRDIRELAWDGRAVVPRPGRDLEAERFAREREAKATIAENDPIVKALAEAAGVTIEDVVSRIRGGVDARS